MAWGALVGGLIAGVASGAMSYASARQSQQETIDAYRHRHQWQTQDLRSAGLNPVLSATQGAGSVGSMAQAQAPDISQTASNFSAAQLRKEEINTAKTTQAQQIAQSAQLTATAKEAEANANIAQQVEKYYQQNPELIAIKARTQAGLNPSSTVGAIGQLSHSSSSVGPDFVNSAKNAFNEWKERPTAAQKLNMREGRQVLPASSPWKQWRGPKGWK